MVNQPPAELQPALRLFQHGNIAGARESVDTALRSNPASPPLLEFGAYLAACANDHHGVVAYNRRLLAVDAAHPVARVNLVAALVSLEEYDAAEALLAGASDPRMLRLRGFVHQQRGRLAEAAADYAAVVAAQPDDFQIWNNLGNVRMAAGDPQGAASAFDQALLLRADVIPIYLNLSEALAKSHQFAARQAAMREAARRAPEDPQVQTDLGLAEAAMRDLDAAEAAFRAAIRLAPQAPAAYVELGLMLETANRVDALDALLAQAERNRVPAGETEFLRAWSLRRHGNVAAALQSAERIPETIHDIRRGQLLGDLYDRAGRSAEAFAAFQAMNTAAAAVDRVRPGPSYRETITRNAALLTPDRVLAWPRVSPAPTPPAPVFIVGFPRSGTTLLDTMLMNLPNLHVLEEQPVLTQATEGIGYDEERLSSITAEDVEALRRQYFERLAAIDPARPDQLIIDKHPLQMARAALIHRIFPDARIVLVERHPCDAVLSCFMANFNLNLATRSFGDLEETARVYDAVFDLWSRATDLLPLSVLSVRYERLIADSEAEMRQLLEFLGQKWDPAVLDNRGSAARRSEIRTASYSQVTEPIYNRAIGRWTRYREHLAPVLPILAPWAERMGYPL
jgi:tetratricopeptide (TPR) repeat protein